MAAEVASVLCKLGVVEVRKEAAAAAAAVLVPRRRHMWRGVKGTGGRGRGTGGRGRGRGGEKGGEGLDWDQFTDALDR